MGNVDCTPAPTASPNAITSEPNSQFSFVWFNFLVIVTCGILWILFLCVAWQKRKLIQQHHDTISSFCASSHKWENKFLLTFTILISMNLLCMFTEEYNSRNQETKFLWLFLMESFAAIVFPLVGICYTEGKDILNTKSNSYKQPLLSAEMELQLSNNGNDAGTDDDATIMNQIKPRNKLEQFLWKNEEILTNGNRNQITNEFYNKLNNNITLNKLMMSNEIDLKKMFNDLPVKMENKSVSNLITVLRDTEDSMLHKSFHIEQENLTLNCGPCHIPIHISTTIHSLAALAYFAILTFTNIYYVYQLWSSPCKRNNTSVGGILCLLFAILNIIVLPSYLLLQGLIHNKFFKLFNLSRLRECSFCCETLSGLIITLGAVIGSMKRNNNHQLDWLD